MPRVQRFDSPGSWHHVMNRAVAKRTWFESDRDKEYFLELLEEVVRRGALEVHALCLMMTHFHLLVWSPVGQLSGSLRWIQSRYVHQFNFSRDRDGPLVRGRFRSKVVECDLYRSLLFQYIDRNPLDAGLASRVGDYPWSSAYHLLRDSRPAWLSTSWVESEVQSARRPGEPLSAAYARHFDSASDAEVRELIERRLRSKNTRIDPLNRFRFESAAQSEWFIERAELGDGTKPFLPIATPNRILSELRADRTCPSRSVRSGHHSVNESAVLEIGLLRDLAAARDVEVAALLQMSRQAAARLLALHRKLVREDAAYRAKCGAAALRIAAPYVRNRDPGGAP